MQRLASDLKRSFRRAQAIFLLLLITSSATASENDGFDSKQLDRAQWSIRSMIINPTFDDSNHLPSVHKGGASVVTGRLLFLKQIKWPGNKKKNVRRETQKSILYTATSGDQPPAETGAVFNEITAPQWHRRIRRACYSVVPLTRAGKIFWITIVSLLLSFLACFCLCICVADCVDRVKNRQNRNRRAQSYKVPPPIARTYERKSAPNVQKPHDDLSYIYNFFSYNRITNYLSPIASATPQGALKPPTYQPPLYRPYRPQEKLLPPPPPYQPK